MNLIAITPPYFYPGEAAAIAEAIRSGGFNRVHIRKPQADLGQLEKLISEIPEELLDRISLHEYASVAEKYPLGGFHITGRTEALPAGFHGILSRSVHSLSELQRYRDECDYIFFSPLFPSISKPGYGSDMDLKQLRPFIDSKVIALGGVTREKLPMLEEAGFGGAAMLGDAWRQRFSAGQFSLQFITNVAPDADVSPIRQLTKQVSEVLRGGCRWIQLRHKDASSEEIVQEAGAIAPMCKERGAIFLLDDHVELVKDTGADGVHLGKNDMPVDEARRMLGPGYIIGATANTAEDIIDAGRRGADYIGLGPFRFTTTKKNLSPVLGLEGYRTIIDRCHREGINLPVVAIGGICIADVAGLIACGASGVAVSGSLINAPDTSRETEKFMSELRNSI